MQISKKTCLFAILSLLVLPMSALAAPNGGGGRKSLEDSKSVKYKSKTEVNFDDATIEGSVRTPFGQGISSRDQKFSRNFINVRKNFHDMMLLSTGGISP
ncbi:hypothetical protein EBR21_05815 [bacterium]|nr:hypothetical protein [bacterium]